jgi:hypothetical protein
MRLIKWSLCLLLTISCARDNPFNWLPLPIKDHDHITVHQSHTTFKQLLTALSPLYHRSLMYTCKSNKPIDIQVDYLPTNQLIKQLARQQHCQITTQPNLWVVQDQPELIAKWLTLTNHSEQSLQSLAAALNKHPKVKVHRHPHTQKLWIQAPATLWESLIIPWKTHHHQPIQLGVQAHLVAVEKTWRKGYSIHLSEPAAKPILAIDPASTLIKQMTPTILSQFFTWLESNHQGQVMASPYLTITSGQPATLDNKLLIPYTITNSRGTKTTEFKEASIELHITAQAQQHQAEVQLTLAMDSAHTDAPHQLTKRRIKTQLVMPYHQHHLVAKLILSESIQSNQTNILAKIPALGQLFKQKNQLNGQKELWCFIRLTRQEKIKN